MGKWSKKAREAQSLRCKKRWQDKRGAESLGSMTIVEEFNVIMSQSDNLRDQIDNLKDRIIETVG